MLTCTRPGFRYRVQDYALKVEVKSFVQLHFQERRNAVVAVTASVALKYGLVQTVDVY